MIRKLPRNCDPDPAEYTQDSVPDKKVTVLRWTGRRVGDRVSQETCHDELFDAFAGRISKADNRRCFALSLFSPDLP